MAEAARPLFVAGAPRMGTTWVSRALGMARGAAWINQPDNDWPDPFALRAKVALGRYPVLDPGDPAPAAYELVWERAFAGYEARGRLVRLARRLGRGDRAMRDLWRATCDHANPRVAPWLRLLSAAARPASWRAVDASGSPAAVPVVKSVHAQLSVEWVARRFEPQVLVCLRHPLNVAASWLEFGWGGCALDSNPRVRRRAERWRMPELPPDRTPVHEVAWEVGLFVSALRDAAARHPEWPAVTHEEMCVEPVDRFRALYGRLGLEWSPEAERYLTESDRPGTGYMTARVAADQPGRWRTRLSPERIRQVWSVLSRIEAPWIAEVAADLGEPPAEGSGGAG